MPRFGTLLSFLLVGVATTATRPALAAVKEFPYEAVIEADETQVRCGPGKNFYVTMKLPRGQHVTVRRHDPGGWFMIEPPSGSFSLIRMDDVTQEGNIATVKRLDQGQASVRIGSSLDPTVDSIFQRKLSSGERAEILGEVIIPRKDRQVHMFRIRPPRGEFRWIEGSDVAPLDPEIKQQLDRDPFSTPPRSQEVRRSPTRQQPTNANSESTPPVVSGPVAHSGPTAPRDKNAATPRVVITQGSFDPRARLEQIDLQFRDMISKQPPTWNLAHIEQAYRDLRRNPAAGGVAGQVDLRFSALAHYKQVKVEYDDYYRLVSATSRRDAELAAVENSLAPQNSRPAIESGPQGSWPTGTPAGENYQPPAGQQSGPPSLSIPSPQEQPSRQPSAAPQSPSDGQNFAPPQVGPTLGTPVPFDNRLQAGPAAGAPPGMTNSPQNYSSGNSNSGQTTPFGPVPTEPVHSDIGPSTAPSQNPPSPAVSPQPRVRTHTSQFAPSPTGQAQSAGPMSSTATPQNMMSPAPQGSYGQQPAPQNQMYAPQNQFSGPPGPMQSQPAGPIQSQPAGPIQPQPPGMQQPGFQFSGQQPMQQPGMQQPSMSQPNMQQPGMQQPGLQQEGMPPQGVSSTPALAPPRQVRPPGSPPLDGAGIVQRAATSVPNGPRHVLLAPNGRILSYLQAGQGVDLDAFVGRPMGVMGIRAYRPELQTDLIVVRGMIPVRLVQ
jgi:uncharacterized protein YgiM (DUF1202 family)